ncbi:MAG: LacI family DNA-binding transcriptional regulator [Verrucomicrobiota bacterium JB024]|nr:LacI family DNA-binding transcriptional regulator [Verrucomicrobiota bacterium JB024]
MREIAAQAGVSVMTVSLALRGSTRVSTETTKRIHDLSKEMGYQNDPALRALIAYRRTKAPPNFSGTIAYINNTSNPNATAEKELFSATINGAKERACDLGYKVEDFWAKSPDMTPVRFSSILMARGIQGLILAPQATPHERMSLAWENFSVVTIGYSLKHPQFNSVAHDPFKSMLLCMENLSRMGYRRVGLSMLEDQDERTQHRYLGAYHAGWDSYVFSGRRIPVLSTKTSSKEPFIQWLTRHRPDAVIGMNHYMMGFIKEAGLKIPQDIGFALPHQIRVVDDIAAHVDGHSHEVGRAALELVTGMIERNEKGIPQCPRTYTIDPTWRERASVRKQ